MITEDYLSKLKWDLAWSLTQSSQNTINLDLAKVQGKLELIDQLLAEL